MVFIVRVCAPGKTHSALVTGRLVGLSPARVRTPRPGAGPSGAKRRNDLKLLQDLGGWSAFMVAIAKNSLSSTVWKSSRENIISAFRSKLPGSMH